MEMELRVHCALFSGQGLETQRYSRRGMSLAEGRKEGERRTRVCPYSASCYSPGSLRCPGQLCPAQSSRFQCCPPGTN